MPKIASVRNFSKYIHVSKSIRQNKAGRAGRAAFMSTLKALMAEHDELLELNR